MEHNHKWETGMINVLGRKQKTISIAWIRDFLEGMQKAQMIDEKKLIHRTLSKLILSALQNVD